MKKLIIGFIIIAITISSLSCNTVTSIQKKRHFSEDCHEALVYFKKHLIKGKDGFFYLKNDTKTEKKLLDFYYHLNGGCFTTTLTQKDVIRIFGKPQHEVTIKRNGHIYLSYYIKTKSCESINDDLSNAANKCGELSFTFTEDGLPFGGFWGNILVSGN